VLWSPLVGEYIIILIEIVLNVFKGSHNDDDRFSRIDRAFAMCYYFVFDYTHLAPARCGILEASVFRMYILVLKLWRVS